METDIAHEIVPDMVAQQSPTYTTADLAGFDFEEVLPRMGDAGDFISLGDEPGAIVRQIRMDHLRTIFIPNGSIEPSNSPAES